MPVFHTAAGGVLGYPSEPDQTSLWGWWSGAEVYTETSGTPTTRQTSDASDIGSLLDLSGNGNHFFQTTTAAKPHTNFAPSGFNGLNCVELDGANHFMSTTNSIGNNMSVYVVLERDTWGTLEAFLGSSSDSADSFLTNGNSSQGSAADDFLMGASAPDSLTAGPVDMSNSTPHLVAGTIDSSNNTAIRLDDEAILTGANLSSTASKILRVGRYSSRPYWDGRFAEMIVYEIEHDLDSDAALQTRRYLNGKYGLGLDL